MKFSYQFANLLGAVYRKGNITFTPDGNSVVSPVGNRVSIFDLKHNKSQTLPVEARLNISAVAVAPNGYTAIFVNDNGEAFLVSLKSQSVIGTYQFHNKVNQVSFSPDGKKFAVTRDTVVLVFHAPGNTREFNPFVLYKTFSGHVDETTCIDWSSDSSVICTGAKDRRTRVLAVQPTKNLKIYDLGGLRQAVVGCFFDHNSLNLISVSKDGFVCWFECDTLLSDLERVSETIEVDTPDAEKSPDKLDNKRRREKLEEERKNEDVKMIQYKPFKKFNYREARKDSAYADLTATAFHKQTRLLISGFGDGSFFLHEMPDFNMIHSLSISEQGIDSIAVSPGGEWLALACGKLGQLCVWEWQSESYVLKQQGHFNHMTCVTFSPDGQNIITGGGDGKVKVWNSASGFCFVTFNEHIGEITGIKVTQNGKSILSSSLDGTVRAFDLTRYRNYKTLTSPRADQFSCLCVDGAGEIVCAGGTNEFLLYVWTMKTGRLLQTLAGHEGPISCVDFSQSQGILASGSWDKTVKLWSVYEHSGVKENLELSSDVLALSFRPDGKELAVATLNAQITFWDPVGAQQTGSIEGRRDLGYSRKDTEKISAKTSAEGKAFESLCYSADGHCVLAGGRSKNVCIYSVLDQILMKKFTISTNLSLDGMEEFLDKRKMTEWGSLALVDSGQGDEGTAIALPGVKKGDHSSRFWKPEVHVFSLQFSPTGRSWVACSTEGLLLYSLDHSVVFDPFELEVDITPTSIRSALHKGDYASSLMLSFRLNEQNLIQEILEAIPVDMTTDIVISLPDVYVDKLLDFVGHRIETSAHIEFYLLWLMPLLNSHGPKLKQRSNKIIPYLRTLQKNITSKYNDLRKIADTNKYSLEYLVSLSHLKRKRSGGDEAMGERELEAASDSDESSLAEMGIGLGEDSGSESSMEFT